MWPGRPLPEDKEIRLVLQSLIVDNMCLFAVGRLAARFGIQTDVAKSLTPSSIEKQVACVFPWHLLCSHLLFNWADDLMYDIVIMIDYAFWCNKLDTKPIPHSCDYFTLWTTGCKPLQTASEAYLTHFGLEFASKYAQCAQPFKMASALFQDETDEPSPCRRSIKRC